MSKKRAHKVFMQLGEYQIVALAILYVYSKSLSYVVQKCIIKMSSFKFNRKKIAFKDFHK